nr:outer envelope pore protein 21B, chloroplastic [Tanacetum cinerariifolium]
LVLEQLRCTPRGKKEYPVVSNREHYYFSKLNASMTYINAYAISMLLVHHNWPKPQGALELVLNILDYHKEQDVRIKVGFELIDKIKEDTDLFVVNEEELCRKIKEI